LGEDPKSTTIAKKFLTDDVLAKLFVCAGENKGYVPHVKKQLSASISAQLQMAELPSV
jgi:hypothetical protein